MRRALYTFILVAAAALLAPRANAQDALVLEVQPPVFQLTIVPGGTWRSQVRVVNPNSYPVSVRIRVVDFEPEGESGGGRFIELEPGYQTSGYAAAQWMTVPDEVVRIDAEQSVTVPVSMKVPPTAEPGSHAAAILIGTVPEGVPADQTAVSANVTSLVVTRVLGEVIEEGFIREFAPEETTYTDSHVPISLRFENTGNVHLEPRGEIVIRNIFGRERGRIPLNRTTDFTTVLPQTVRRFDFVWEGERGDFEIGPYTAELSLAFGEEQPTTASAETRFWVIPAKPLAIVGAGVLFFIASLLLIIRSAVRRSVVAQELRGKPLGSFPPGAVQAGVVDLRGARPGGAPSGSSASPPIFTAKRWGALLPGLIGLGLLVGSIAMGLAIRDSAIHERNFAVTLTPEDGDKRRLTKEELAVEPALDVSGELIREGVAEVVYELDVAVLNGSGISGVATELAEDIAFLGYSVGNIGNADSFNYARTEIKYIPGAGDVVEAITRLLPVSPKVTEDPTLKEAQVVVIVGQDLQ